MEKVTNEDKHECSHEMERKDANLPELALQEAKEVLAETNIPNAGRNPYVSVYSMILTALQLAEIYDDQPGKERRIEILNQLAKEFNRFATLPYR